MPKTYVPSLRDKTNDWLKYVANYLVKLDGALDAPTMEKLEAAQAALTELSLALGVEVLLP